MKIVLLALAFTSAVAHDFKICSGVTDHFKLTGVTLSPDPVQGGKMLNISFEGTPDKALTAGKAEVAVKVFGVKIATLDFDLCKDLGMNCPIPKGKAAKGFFSYDIPSAAPKGVTATVEMKVTDGSGASITCIDVSATIGAASSTNLRASQPDAESIFDPEAVKFLFDAWRAEHGVEFATPEESARRLAIFADNLKAIYDHNRGPSSFTKAMNQFGHLTPDEFKAHHLGFKRPANPVLTPRDFFTFPWSRKQELASSVDWVSKGAVTDPKNQGSCGGCWSFSTTGAIEGAYFIKTGTLTSLSEQQLVSCDSTDEGCNGGLMDHAFDWVASNGGLCTEADYPYTSTSGTAPSCTNTCTVVDGTAPSRHTDVDKTESALMAAVAQQPVSIAIEADQSAFQFYSGGVMKEACGTKLDHGVLAVGYGTDGADDYWKIKNSWGATWGESGFIRIQRGNTQAGGQCGILMSASYPTL